MYALDVCYPGSCIVLVSRFIYYDCDCVLLFRVRWFYVSVIGFRDLSEKVKERLSPKKRKYSKRNLLRRRMLSAHESFKDFVTGENSGSDEHFFFRICKRDVTIRTHGVSEIIRLFGSVGH